MVELMFFVMVQEQLAFNIRYYGVGKTEITTFKQNKELQATFDCMRISEEQGVRTFSEVDACIRQVGTDLSEVRQGLKYYTNAVERGDELYQAIRTFNTMEAHLKKNGALTAEEQMIHAEAKRVMAAHNCTEPLQIGQFFNKRYFAEKKVKDLTAQEQKLRKDYHDLKFIESHSAYLDESIEYYIYQNNDAKDLNDLIARAETKTKSAETRSAPGFVDR